MFQSLGHILGTPEHDGFSIGHAKAAEIITQRLSTVLILAIKT